MDSEDAAIGIDEWEVQLRKGSLELAILVVLWSERAYGLEIVRRLAEGPRLDVPEGTVYPLLARLRAKGWLDAEWVESVGGHPRKYYELTQPGRRRTLAMARAWRDLVDRMAQLLAPLPRSASQ